MRLFEILSAPFKTIASNRKHIKLYKEHMKNKENMFTIDGISYIQGWQAIGCWDGTKSNGPVIWDLFGHSRCVTWQEWEAAKAGTYQIPL